MSYNIVLHLFYLRISWARKRLINYLMVYRKVYISIFITLHIGLGRTSLGHFFLSFLTSISNLSFCGVFSHYLYPSFLGYPFFLFPYGTLRPTSLTLLPPSILSKFSHGLFFHTVHIIRPSSIVFVFFFRIFIFDS